MKFLGYIFWLGLVGCSHFHRQAKASPVAEINFYSSHDPYGEFSNFAPYPVFVDNKWWPTSEHYYQAHKYEKPELIEWVRSAPTPMEAALRGRNHDIPKRPDWEQSKDGFMEKAVTDKFTRYKELSDLLLSTGEAHLFEHTTNDCYWADCGDRSGKNKLGHLLEKIRTNLKNSELARPHSDPN